MSSPREDHWNKVYSTKAATEVSWFQEEPAASLALIDTAGIGPDDAIVDVGGGASLLVDRLLDRGQSDITVLDIAETGLAVARARLGAKGAGVAWTVQDVTRWQPPPGRFRLWHDRAVFHFLIDEADRRGYLAALDRGLRAGGYLILAAFAPTGPERCSGLPVRRYSGESMQAVLGPGFRLLAERPETHPTPAGGRQDFTWCLFRKLGET